MPVCMVLPLGCTVGLFSWGLYPVRQHKAGEGDSLVLVAARTRLWKNGARAQQNVVLQYCYLSAMKLPRQDTATHCSLTSLCNRKLNYRGLFFNNLSKSIYFYKFKMNDNARSLKSIDYIEEALDLIRQLTKNKSLEDVQRLIPFLFVFFCLGFPSLTMLKVSRIYCFMPSGAKAVFF